MESSETTGFSWDRLLNLKGKFFIYFTGLVIMTVSIVSVAVYFFQSNMLRKQAEEKALSLTRTLAYASLNAILLDDYITVQMLIDGMSDGQDIISVAILDTEGKILAGNKPEMRGQKPKDNLTQKALKTDHILLQSAAEKYDGEVWDTAVPIFNLNHRVGTARIKYSVEDTYKGLINTIIAIGLFAVLVSMFLAYRFAVSISRPIQQAAELADEYGKGNLDAEIRLERKDEVGQLVNNLNLMANKLETLIEEKIANENLIMIGEFGSYIIHDLKNPLSGIHLLADGLNRKLQDEHPLKKYAIEILLASKKLEDFTRRTLDISKPTRLNIRPLDVNQLIEDTLNDVQFHSVNVQRDFAADLKEIRGDYQLLQMAITNLLSNAIEATEENGKVTIATRIDKELSIIVSDDGIGIPRERLATIFRPFFSMKNKGHGLGLAMVKKAVIAHQGEVDVESEPGAGSVFTIRIPLTL